jgi:hypothetical protein
MTKEEIKEMIDSTINENGERNITGKALNLALNAIVDAMGGGNGALKIYSSNGQETEEQKENNILVREQCRIIAESGGTLPVINVDLSSTAGIQGVAMSYVALGAAYDTIGAILGEPAFLVFIYEGGQVVLMVNADGTTSALNNMSTFSLNR